MINHYARRGYPMKILLKHAKDVISLKQDDLLEVKPRRDDKIDRVILTLEYNPANPDILGIINSEWHLLEASSKLTRLFPNKPMLAHKRSPNLSDTLVRATTEYPKVEKLVTKFNCNEVSCKRKYCPLCPSKSSQGHIQSMLTKQSYRTVNKVSCETKNVIYCLNCTKCGKQYVGETKRSFRIRINEHLGDIRNHRNYKPVAKHFNSRNHTIHCVQSVILETITQNPELSSTTDHRRSREQYWIYRLRSLDPIGLNAMG
jgi:hypothetical protein